MAYGQLYEETGAPFKGRKREKLISFLSDSGLDYDDTVDYSVMLCEDDGTPAAAGSLSGKVIKCIAVAENHRGENLTARVISLITDEAVRRGITHLFLYTKPENTAQFSGVSFYPVLRTKDVLFMENKKGGIDEFVENLKAETAEKFPGFQAAKRTGAIVANCNPFTLGHRYLIEKAAAECDILHLFVVSEDASLFTSEERYMTVKAGVSDMENVIVHRSGDYMISRAVFPTYFLKDKTRADDISCELDLRIFGEYLAGPLGIDVRFVGTEPFSPVTAAYNEAMKRILPEYGVKVTELERVTDGDGRVISASRVRQLLASGKTGEALALVPDVTKSLIKEKF